MDLRFHFENYKHFLEYFGFYLLTILYGDIYSVSNAGISKNCKITFCFIFFFPRLLEPENYWKYLSPYCGDPSTFFKENILYSRLNMEK